MNLKRFSILFFSAIAPSVSAVILACVMILGVAGNSFGACINDPGLSQKASEFVSNPASLLNGPNGPRSPSEISAEVRNFVAANPLALAAVISILKNHSASPEQQKAIGTGLGLAAGMCLRPDPAFAAEIQTQIAGTDSVDAKAQYSAITGNQLIGSVGGGSGGAGSTGAAGGSTNPIAANLTASSAFQPFLSNSVSNTPTNYFNSSVGGISSSGSTTTNTTTTSTTSTTVCRLSVTC